MAGVDSVMVVVAGVDGVVVVEARVDGVMAVVVTGLDVTGVGIVDPETTRLNRKPETILTLDTEAVVVAAAVLDGEELLLSSSLTISSTSLSFPSSIGARSRQSSCCRASGPRWCTA